MTNVNREITKQEYDKAKEDSPYSLIPEAIVTSVNEVRGGFLLKTLPLHQVQNPSSELFFFLV